MTYFLCAFLAFISAYDVYKEIYPMAVFFGLMCIVIALHKDQFK